MDVVFLDRTIESSAVMPIFIHGFMGDSTDAPDGFETALLPSHGGAPPATDWESAVEHVAEQIPQSADVVAYSMGGRVALGVAQTYPTLISRLTLIAAHPGLPLALRDERLRIDLERATELERDPDAFLETWSQLPLFGPQVGERWERYSHRARRPEEWAAALRVMTVGHQPSYHEVFDQIEIRYVVGQFDHKYVELAKELRAEVLEVPNAWHAVHRDQPELLKEFLA